MPNAVTLTVTYKPFVPNVVMLSVVMMSVVAPGMLRGCIVGLVLKIT